VEVLPRFKPHQYRRDVPGVVSVMIFPKISGCRLPSPRPDRLLLEQVHEWLDARRPLAVELYVIGPEYVDVGVGVAVDIRSGHSRDKVLKDVRQHLRSWLWALEPGGNTGRGWKLGRPVIDQELEVEAARVAGVNRVSHISLYVFENERWREVEAGADGLRAILLKPWQLPQLLTVAAADDVDLLPADLGGSAPAAGEERIKGTPIPVVAETC
jgi:hypothetical protein